MNFRTVRSERAFYNYYCLAGIDTIDSAYVHKGELRLYRRLAVPLPEKCPNCRYEELLRFRLPRRLWKRVCMCEVKEHDWDQGGRRSNEFETSYSPERPEIVYCEQCYLREVV